MNNNLVEEVWDEIYDQAGQDLRAVVQFDATSSDSKFRDDVAEQYEMKEMQHIINDTIVQQLNVCDQEEDFHAGDLESFVRVFESSWVLTWRKPGDVKAGFLISIQRDGYTATMNDIEYCIQHLNNEIQPRI